MKHTYTLTVIYTDGTYTVDKFTSHKRAEARRDEIKATSPVPVRSTRID